jgi:hypothetical protein
MKLSPTAHLTHLLRPARLKVDTEIVSFGTVASSSADPPVRSRQKIIRRRLLACVTALAMAVGCVTVAAATPAAAKPVAASEHAAPAQSGPTQNAELCLTNDDAACVGFNYNLYEAIVSGIGTAAAVAAAIFAWLAVKNSKKQDQGESEDEDAPELGECLAATGGYAYLANCGADGTVWIAVPHSDGYYLESRYSVDNNLADSVLTADPLAGYARLYVYTPEQPGGPWWQTWSWYQTGIIVESTQADRLTVEHTEERLTLEPTKGGFEIRA